MDENLHSFGNSLNTCVENNKPNEAEELISQINKSFTESELLSFTIDTYLLSIFNKSNGLLNFLEKILHKSEYKKAKLKCFELLYTLVNNCTNKIQNYLTDIIKVCSPVVRSSASATEKQKSLQLITLIIQKGNLHGQDDVDAELGDLYNTTLFKCLHYRFDKSNTVQEALLVAIGAVTQKFPSVIRNSSELRKTLLNQLSRELHKSDKDKSYPVITGCVMALSNFLENFPYNPEYDKDVADAVYKCVKILADPGDASRKVAFRESLFLVTKHIALLSNALYSEARWWHTTLLKWFNWGIEDKKAAYGILDAFYQEMVNILNTRNQDSDHELFKYFMDYFSDVITKSTAENYEMQLAIRGYGLLAESFKTHITPQQISETFITISQIMEHTYILNEQLNSDQLMYLPHYIQTLSFIIKNLPQLSESHISCMQRVSVLMIKIFPKVPHVQHYAVIDAFILTAFQLSQCKGNVLENFLEDVIYQGVLWTCSHDIVLDAELYKDQEQQITTCKSYLPLWKGLLNIINSTKFEKYGLNMKKRKLIVRKLLDELIKTLFLLINKLNLNVKPKDMNLPVTDPESAYEAVQTNDFIIFVNVVDFYQDIMKNVEQGMFKTWISRFINQVILKSMKNPLVSGFYKLLAACLKVSDNLNYFEKSKLSYKEDLNACYQSVCKFLQEILWQMKQYKGDLQVACMEVILATPICIVKNVLPCAVPAFIALFSVGRSYLKLADLGIDALQRWLKHVPQNDYIPFLKQVLPSLDSYLRSRSLGGNIISNQILKTRKTKLAVSKRKVLVETESELLKLQIKILTFLGQLDNDELYLTFISSGDFVEPVVWSKTPYLKITLPYAGTKLNLYLDKFLPRSIELALYSSDRKMRVAACELLHAIVVIILGTSHPIDHPKLKDLDCLMKAVSIPVLKLGCDTDEVIQQLFRPLALQLMHYYSHPRQMLSSHTQIIVEALIEVIANPSDSALRDFAGVCIKEFVSWTIKQADPDDLKNNSINIKLWVRTMYSFSLHPDPFKRLGAALIFNHVYTILREETYMFNMFWLEILYAFVLNLSLIQVNNIDDNNCIDQVSQALNHIERGFVQKHKLFNTNDDTRRKPPGFEGNSLKDVAIWLLKETGSLNPYCRQKCMSMFCNIAPLVTNCNNDMQTFNQLYIINDPEWIAVTYEFELLKNPSLNNLQNTEDTTNLFKWMQSLLCALDGYIFVIANKLLPITFTSEKSVFFNSLQFFLQSIQLQGCGEVMNLISNNGNTKLYTAIESENFNNFKSSIVTKIIEFVNMVLKNKADLTYITATPQLLWENNLWNLICHRLFFAPALGFDITNEDDYEDLIHLLNHINNCCASNVVNSLINSVATYIISTLANNIDAGLNIISLKQRNLLKGMLLLQQSLLAEKLNIGKYVTGTVKTLLSGLAESKDGKKILVKLHKSAVQYWELRLDIALIDKKEFSDMIEFMLNYTKVEKQEQNEEIEYGIYFFEKFHTVILKYLLKNYVIFIDTVVKFDTVDHGLKYVLEMLRYIHRNLKAVEQNILETVVQVSLNYMEKMLSYFDTNIVQKLLGIEFIIKLAGITVEPLQNFNQNKPALTSWVISLIHFEDLQWNTEASLNFKVEVFKALSYVIGPSDEFEEELRNALQYSKQKYFALKPDNISSKLTVVALKKLLEAAKICKSKILLSCIADIYVTVPFSVDDVDLNRTLKPFMKYIPVEHQVNTLLCVHKMSFDTVKFTSIQRYLLVKDVLSILLKSCCYSAFEQFFINVITSLLSIFDETNNPSNFSVVHTVNKVIAYIFIEVLFSRIRTENIKNNSCAITKAALPVENSNKTLAKTLTEYASQVCKEKYNFCGQEEKDMFRLYQCHSYNALVSIITNTQKGIKFYDWLFSREDILWKNLVDVDKNYSFAIDFDTVPSAKKVLVNIRKDLLVSRKNVDPNVHTIKYIESQHLFKSTLSEDITEFDFTHTTLRNQFKENESRNENIENSQEVQITLESIDINNHECMATICALIHHMIENDISPLPVDNEDIALPKWMKGIRNALINETTSKNAKVFITKVIHNTHHIFKPYAKWFLAPIIKVIVDGCAGTTINFFIADLIVMLTSWSSVAIPKDDQELVSELLKFLMNNADSDRRAIFKYNLEQIKMIVEVWKSCFVVPYDDLYQKLQLDLTSPKLDIGIHLVAVVLANNIAPWHPAEVKKFLMTLTKIINSSHRSVYQPCAEVLGMSLKYMTTNPDSSQHLDKFQDYLHKCLLKFVDDDDKFAYCLQGLALHFPVIADKFLCKMVSKLDHIHGNFKSMYLKVFLARIDILHSINELSSIGFQKLLLNEVFEVQVLTLEVIKKSVEYLRNIELVPILTEVSKFISNSFIICRTLMYDIIIASYTIHYTQQSEASKEVTDICKDILLQGLVDTESALQEKVITFWSNANNLPLDVSKRFLYLLDKMYKANIEEHYVSYSTYLLLNVLTSTEEFNEKLFEYALHECDFQDYQLISNWRRQHASIAPLFAETLRSQDSTISAMNLNVLRSTASTLEFQPTQAAGTSMPTSKSNYSTNTSSLIFSTSTSDNDEKQDGVFKDPNYVLPAMQGVQSRRFLRDKSKISRHCAYLEARKSLKAEELRKDKINQRERNVTIYRKYRIGDYPDIEITLSSIIIPLQMLARCDAVLARCLYTSLFASLFGKMGTDGKQDDTFVESIKLSINNIFSSSTQFIPNTIGTFLDIALTYKNVLQFDPNVISNVCHFSGLFSVGSLLLEEYLISEDVNYTTPAKRRKGVENQNIICWVKFAELYKEMNEWDVVRAIFLEKMNCSDMVLNAIEAESSKNWRSAQECYASVIAEDTSEERKDFYYESYFKCFAALAEWDKLSDIIEETVVSANSDNVWTALWDNDWNQQKLLPWYITAELRNILHGTDRKLFVYINESLSDIEKVTYLKLNFGEELAMLWLLQNDSGSATYYLNNSINNFLENWSQLNPLFVKLRINKVLNLRNIIDIYLFLNTVRNITIDNYENVVEVLSRSWQEMSEDSMESLILNETRIVYRNQFISTLKTKLQSILSDDDLQLKDKSLNECKFKLHLNLVESALDQGNYYVARKYIKLGPRPNTNNQIEKMQWSLALSRILFLRAQTVNNNEAKLSVLMDSWSQIDTVNNSVTEDNTMCYLIKAKEHVYHITQEIFKIISKNELLFNKNQQKLQELAGDFSLTNIETIWCFGMSNLQSSLDVCENEIKLMMNNDNLKVYAHMGDAYVKLAYCTQNKGEKFENDFILNVLKAITHGSAEGKQLFPCLFSKDIGITYKNTFIEESSQIPVWMFLGWLPQLLANLDTSCIFAISDILLQIGKMYPQAIMYAYRLSKEKYSFKSDNIGISGKELIRKLDDLLLHDCLIDKFLMAVACVAPPTNILRYHLRKLLNSCNSREQFDVVLQKMFDELYSEKDYKNVDSIQGSMFKEIRKYEKKLQNICKGKFAAAENGLRAIDEDAKNLKYKKSSKLIDYSPWLANFQATDLCANLEIPGQYTGEKRPLMQYHIKIMGFSQHVQNLASIRAPIRVAILGNDAKEYHYLIKFGEDLRQDQRIEQIFNLMNKILSHDANCHKRQLSIYTYQVIPLNSCLGILEWVNNTTELKEFIENGINDQEEKSHYKKKTTDNSYANWIATALPRSHKGSSVMSYGFACVKFNRDNVICKYRTFVNSLSLDVLRQSFWNISVNSESFFALRHKFATSYAVMCISHWLLGIGDRHLSNCLISLRTGQAIGIDFGHAFGTATQILQVPELLPFRLTPHILYLLQPLGEQGLLQENMIHCLRAFRKKSDILLATMNVFIKEPSLDWLEFSRRSELLSRSPDQDWYPNQKLMHAQQKLQGANPTSITIEELRAGHSHTQFLDAYINLVKGTPEYNFRARKENELSEEDQVKCLLDQSTDYNLLGRMWVGWQPWI